MNNVTFLVGARAYVLARGTARRLAERLRRTYTDAAEPEASAALQLAWAIEIVLEGRDEALELGLSHVAPVLTVVHEEGVPPSPGLIALQDALRRLQFPKRE